MWKTEGKKGPRVCSRPGIRPFSGENGSSRGPDERRGHSQEGADCAKQGLEIHPSREGNARNIKLLTDLLAALTERQTDRQTDRPLLLYDQTEEGIHVWALSISLFPASFFHAQAVESARGLL